MSLALKLQQTVKKPELTHTINQFITVGRSASNLTYTKLCLQETHDNIQYVVKNILDDYVTELKALALKVKLSDKEKIHYQFNPKLMAYDVYGSTVFYPFILKVNDMCSVREFNTDILRLVPKATLMNALNSIYRNEKNNILVYNSKHN